MDWDDLQPKPARAATLGENLEAFSVAELQSRVLALQAEISRVEVELAAKKVHEAAAAQLFRS